MWSVNDTGKSVVWLFTLVIASSALASASGANYQAKPVSDEQAKEDRLDTSFHKKCTMVQNLLIATSDRVSNHAHLEAAYQFDTIMKSINPKVAQRVRDRKALCILIGHQELTFELPQFACEKTGKELDFYNGRRLRDKHAETAALHRIPESPLWLTYKGADGPGRGKHIVLIAADQEYRSEQSMPMLAKILARRHGFDCTVLFSLNEKNEVDPTQKIRWQDKNVIHSIPGLEHLPKADLLVLFSRLITLPDEQINHIITYLDSGKPVIGIRTANHGFLQNFPYMKNGKRVRFGEDVLGGSFRKHHGRWHADSTRGIIVEDVKDHPILVGVNDIWGPSDVYRTYPEGKSLPAGCQALVYGQPLLERQPHDGVNTKKEPLPIAWTKSWTGSTGKTARVFHVTMGSAKDYENAGLRRLTINAAYWCLGMETHIRTTSSVEYVGDYKPLPSGFNYEKLKVIPKKPEAYR